MAPHHAPCRWTGFVAGGLMLWASGAQAETQSGAGQPTGFAAPDEQPVTVELIGEHASIQPGGTTRIGVHFELEGGWHIYAQEPGDAGLPTQVSWSVPPIASVSELVWPTPQAFLDPGDIRTFGYSGTVVLYSTLTYRGPGAIARAVESEIPVRASVNWLACKELCIPGSAELELALPVSFTPPVFSSHAQFFEHVS